MKTGKTNKVGKNTEMANTKTNKGTHFKQVSAITNRIRSIGGIFQSLLFVQKIFADISKEIEAVANTEKKAEKVGYGYSKRV